MQRLVQRTVLDGRVAIRMQDRRGEAAPRWLFIHLSGFPSYKTQNPSGLRQTGWVCPAWYLQAGADLALAVFVTRPQAEAQIGASDNITQFAVAVKIPGGRYRAAA